jgi:hypothetical protein
VALHTLMRSVEELADGHPISYCFFFFLLPLSKSGNVS